MPQPTPDPRVSGPLAVLARAQLPTEHGPFEAVVFTLGEDPREHVALVHGAVAGAERVPVRVHSECLTGEAFASLKCDCGAQLDGAMREIVRRGAGVVVYLRQEGRGIGLANKIRAYHLQDGGADTVEANERLGFAADQREYSICLPMLDHLGIHSLKLMTNNPRKVNALEGFGIRIAERKPLLTGLNPHNRNYLRTKAGKLGHMLGNLHQDESDT